MPLVKFYLIYMFYYLGWLVASFFSLCVSLRVIVLKFASFEFMQRYCLASPLLIAATIDCGWYNVAWM